MSQLYDPITNPVTGPAIRSFVVTPDDDTDLPERVRAVTISNAGAVAYHDYAGEARATAVLPPGTYPMQAQRILDTGTSASDITGWV
jgi:hypothetical protein